MLKSSAVLIAFIACWLTQSAAQASTFDVGVKQYRQGNIIAARGSFEQVLQEQPGNAYAHYYLANCLGRQGHGKQALANYERAKKLSAHPQLQEYCDLAINHYETQELTKDYYAKAAVQANKLARQMAADLAAQRRIKQQLASKMSLAISDESRFLAARIHKMAEMEIDCLPRRGNMRGVLADEIRAEAKRKAQFLLEHNNRRAECYRRQAEAELEAYRQAADNLTHQMAAPLNKNGFGLSPHGTNLYVRNYTRP